MKTTPIDSKNAGLQNESLVLRILRAHGRISQTQLCRLTGLPSSTTSYIIGRLREKGLLIEERGQSEKRGAKPVIVSINPSGRFAVGVEISPADVFMGLFNLNCSLIESLRIAISPGSSPETVANLLEINIRGLLSKNKITQFMLAGIGCSLSGSISKDGKVELSSPLGWKSVPLKQMLQSRFTCPVSLHTTRVRLLAENTLSPAIASQNILYINIGNGVGSHAVIDGHLIHGSDNRSGEIGHIIVDPNGPMCGCGHRGCLEAFISGPALAKRILADMASSNSCLREQVNETDLPKEVIAKWGKAVEAGDQYALELRTLAGSYLSRVAAAAINCYDPDILMLAGYVAEPCMDYLVQCINEKIQTDVFDSSTRRISIIPARAGELAIILGTAAAVLQEYMEMAT